MAASKALLFAPIVFILFAFASPARADEIAPAMYAGGNLRVAVTCAESFGSVDNGLRVAIDGNYVRPLRTNAISNVTLDSNNNQVVLTVPTDVGFVVPPGHHHMRVEMPDCEADDREIDVSPSHARFVEGRLLLANDSLKGTVGAPDGFGLVLGGYTMGLPRSLLSGSGPDWARSPTAYTIDPASTHGLWLVTSVERRYFTFALDSMWGWGSANGHIAANDSSPATDFSASMLQWSMALRIGARLPLRYASLAAGSGIGFSLWIFNHTDAANRAAMTDAVSNVNAVWQVPLWASLTIKPACGWGIQGLASYGVQPTRSDASSLFLGIGILFQPSASCSETPGVDVSP
jgi:hypothetical protein